MKIKKFVFNPFEENTYIVSDETKEAIVIDAGCLDKEEKRLLKEYIADNQLIIKYILNTHLHIDHQFGNRFLFENYFIAPLAGKEDEFFLDTFREQTYFFGIKVQEEPAPLGGYLIDNQKINFGNTSLQVFHVPGHSPGSMAFYFENEKAIFTGDVLFKGTIGRTDFEKGDFDTIIRSIIQRLLPLPDETVVYSGHGPITTIANEKKYNPYLQNYC